MTPWIDRAVEWLSPERALRRAAARTRIQRFNSIQEKKRKGEEERRSFEAVLGGRTRYDFITDSSDADTTIAAGAEALRQHVRQLEFNNGFIAGPIKRIVDNVVGIGFTFHSAVEGQEENPNDLFQPISQQVADRFNQLEEVWWQIWARKWADVQLISNFRGLLAIIEASLFRDGESLIVGRNSSRAGRPVPFCLQVYEIDRLQTPFSEVMNPKIRNGIEFDDEGVPKTYYVLKYHPGNTLSIAARLDRDFEDIPAFNADGSKKVFHLFNPLRPEQTRGFTEFAAALKDLQDLDRYTEAEKFAMLEDACLTGFVTTPAPNTFQQNYTEETDSGGNRIHEFAPAKWHYMRPGESVEIHAPSRPNQSFGEVISQLLRGPSNAIDIPPEVYSQNWQGMNYSNARTVLLQFYLTCRIRQKNLMDHLLDPVHENVTGQFVGAGLVPAPGFDSLKETYFSHIFTPPGWDWVDPVKEAQGAAIDLENNLDSLTAIHASKGDNLDDFIKTRAMELKKLRLAEEKYGIKFPVPGSKIPAGNAEGDQTGNQAND